MKKIYWFILFLVLGVSCLDQPDCYRQNSNLIGISFKKLFDQQADSAKIRNVYVDGNLLTGYEAEISTVGIALELNYFNEKTTIAFERLKDDGTWEKDTLNLGYRSRPQFVSEKCGARFVLSDLQILGSAKFATDSVRLLSNLPGNTASTNIAVYRCPRPNIMRFGFRQLYISDDSLGSQDLRLVKAVTIDTEPSQSINEKISSLLLSLNSNAEKISCKVEFDNEEKNISFTYKMTSKQVFDKCGTQIFFHSLDTVDNDFSFIKIFKDSVYDPPRTNVVSYRCPTTNEVSLGFRLKKGDSRTTSVTIKNLEADYNVDLSGYQSGTAVSSLILPLNPSADVKSTRFTFEIDGQPKVVKLNYTAERKTFKNGCGEVTVYSELAIDQESSGFSSISVLNQNVKFPAATITNVEVIP